MSVYSLNNPVFANLLFYGAIVVLKMLGMALLTGFFRVTRGVYQNPEDNEKFKIKKAITDDEMVERVRRNHLNDLENIPAFLLIALMYIGIEPSLGVAVWHFRAFTIARVFHTIAYQMPLPQPSRGVGFIVGLVSTISMAVQVLAATF